MLQEDIQALVSRLEQLITTKTIIGEPITSGDVTIIPVMSAAFGFGIGAGEGKEPGKGTGQGSGAGAGAKITPVALVIIQAGEVKVSALGGKGTLEKMIDLIPEVVAKFAKGRGEGREDRVE